MNKLYLLLILTFIMSCGEKKLPILGERTVDVKIINGKEVVDSIYSTVPDFSLINQNGKITDQKTIKDKIYIADFFFVSCPTICPKMKKNMLTIYQKFKGNSNILFLSHTIDPEHDSVSVLNNFAKRIGADSKQWMFLTGNRDSIYNLASKGYYATALPDSTEPGGFVHSGGLILVDKKRRVRGIYDGTSEKDAAVLINDIEILLNEKD